MSVGYSLSIVPSEAFEALVDVVEILTEDHGEEVAVEWLNRVIAMSGELFMKCSIESDMVDGYIGTC